MSLDQISDWLTLARYLLCGLVIACGLAQFVCLRVVVPSPAMRVGLLLVLGACLWGLCWACLNLEMIVVARLALAIVFFVLSAIALVLLAFSARLRQALIRCQHECEAARDEVIFASAVARAQLAVLKQRLSRGSPGSQGPALSMAVKLVGPLLVMFAHHETSMIKWFFAALKLGRWLVSRRHAGAGTVR